MSEKRSIAELRGAIIQEQLAARQRVEREAHEAAIQTRMHARQDLLRRVQAVLAGMGVGTRISASSAEDIVLLVGVCVVMRSAPAARSLPHAAARSPRSRVPAGGARPGVGGAPMTGHAVVKKIINITDAEYRDHADNFDGVCLACEAWTPGGVEPDAEGYTCDMCGAAEVLGAEQALIAGNIEFCEEES